MRSRILLGGTNTSICLDLARKFHSADYDIDMFGVNRLTFSRLSNSCSKYHVIPKPSDNLDNFMDSLETLVNNVQLVIPVMEDVFFLSKLKSRNESLSKKIFCDDFEKLTQLHNKWEFTQLSQRWSLKAPETILIKDFEDWLMLKLEAKNYVFKPSYSRFATDTLISPDNKSLEIALSSNRGSWIAQKRVYGEELCTYCIAHHGKLKAFACYKPTFSFGLAGGIYLTPIFDEAVFEFCKQFVENENFHGQFGFDIIHDTEKDKHWLLECNPRSTNGVTLLDSNVVDAFLGLNKDIIIANTEKSKMISAMVFIVNSPKSLSLSRWKKFLQQFRQASDIMWDPNDKVPLFGGILLFCWYILWCIILRRSFKDLMHEDLIYNGNFEQKSRAFL